jgi:hypothetical protein
VHSTWDLGVYVALLVPRQFMVAGVYARRGYDVVIAFVIALLAATLCDGRCLDSLDLPYG